MWITWTQSLLKYVKLTKKCNFEEGLLAPLCRWYMCQIWCGSDKYGERKWFRLQDGVGVGGGGECCVILWTSLRGQCNEIISHDIYLARGFFLIMPIFFISPLWYHFGGMKVRPYDPKKKSPEKIKAIWTTLFNISHGSWVHPISLSISARIINPFIVSV